LAIVACELFVWGNLRLLLLPQIPMIEMFCSISQDTLWLPPALALPGYLFWLAMNLWQRTLPRIAAAMGCAALFIWAVVDAPGFFRSIILWIALMATGIIFYIRQQRHLRANVFFFTLACLGIVAHYGRQLLPAWPLAGDSRPSLSILDYNILVDQRGEKRKPVLELIREKNPDIVFIQEINRQDRKLFTEQFSEIYPYQLWADRFEYYNGGVILSRFPFKSASNVNITSHHLPGHTNLNHAVIEWNGRDVHLFNVHLFPSGHAFLQMMFGRRSFGSFVQHTRNAFLRRIDEARQLSTIMEPIADPIIMAGDFNDTPNSSIYRLFSRKFTNAFADKGWGMGTTFGQYSLEGSVAPAWQFLLFDFLRIDQIFISREWSVEEAQVLEIDASDHRPQWVRLRWR